eukprot:GHVT01039966.1.p1 GENE.GHVT01039966.1~~GHVT01039966.1.p1  ORF type:complete len:424 (+),score=102.39 GHVT01039966.1:515-1786(+)
MAGPCDDVEVLESLLARASPGAGCLGPGARDSAPLSLQASEYNGGPLVVELASGSVARTCSSPCSSSSPSPCSQSSACSSSSSSAVCAVCRSGAARYRCPACGLRSCSLGCCQAHKVAARCSGKRRRIVPVAAIKSYDDHALLADFRLLEDAGRIVESSARLMLQEEPRRQGPAPTDAMTRAIRRACLQRSICWRIAPGSLHARRTNSSAVKGNRLLWRVRWTFPAINKSFLDPKLSELNTFQFGIARLFNNQWPGGPTKKCLAAYASAGWDNLRVLWPDLSRPATASLFFSSAMRSRIKDALSGTTVVEHPEFLIVTMDELPAYKVHPRPVVAAPLPPAGRALKNAQVEAPGAAAPPSASSLDAADALPSAPPSTDAPSSALPCACTSNGPPASAPPLPAATSQATATAAAPGDAQPPAREL